MTPSPDMQALSAIENGDEAVLREILSGTRRYADEKSSLVGQHLHGVLRRSGWRAATAAADRIMALDPRHCDKSSCAWFVSDLVGAAAHDDEPAAIVSWTQRVPGMTPDGLDRHILWTVTWAETRDDKRPFERLVPFLSGRKAYVQVALSVIAVRFARDSVEDATALAVSLMVRPEDLDLAATLLTHADTAGCGRPRMPWIDPLYQLTKSSPYCHVGGPMRGALVLGYYLARGGQAELAARAFDRYQPDGQCPRPGVSAELGRHLLAAGDEALALRHAMTITENCRPGNIDYRSIAHLLGRYGDPTATVELARQLEAAASPRTATFAHAVLAEFAARGLGPAVAAIIRSAGTSKEVLWTVHENLPLRATGTARGSIAAVLAQVLPLHRENYLSSEFEQGAFYMTDYARAGMADQVTDLVQAMTERAINRINDPGHNHMRALSDLGCLFFVTRTGDPGFSPEIWAARIEREESRNVFRAFAAEAMALLGDAEGATALASTLPRGSKAYPDEDALQIYAWYAIALALSRRGQPGEGYRIASEHGVLPDPRDMIAVRKERVLEGYRH